MSDTFRAASSEIRRPVLTPEDYDRVMATDVTPGDDATLEEDAARLGDGMVALWLDLGFEGVRHVSVRADEVLAWLRQRGLANTTDNWHAYYFDLCKE